MHAKLVSKLLCSSVKSMKTLAALRPETGNTIAVNLPIQQLHFSHHFYRLLAWLFLNLSLHERTLIAEFAPRLWFVNLILGWLPITARWSCAITPEVPFALRSISFPKWTSTSQNPSSRSFFSHLFQPAAQRKVCTLVSFLHAYFDRAGNYSCLLSNTILSLAIAIILPILSQRYFDLCES